MSRIINIGCWAGNHVKELLDEGHDAYGADIDTSRFIPEIKDKLFYLDITKPLPKTKPFDKKFDLIFFEEVLEHLEEGKDIIALENLYKLLNKGGTLILTTPKSIPYMEDWDPSWVRWKLGLGPRHYHYSLKELLIKLSQRKFILCDYKLHGNLWWLFTRWFNLPLKHIFHSKRLLQASKRKGYFDWEVTLTK